MCNCEFSFDRESAERIEQVIKWHPICLKDCADILEIIVPLCDLCTVQGAEKRIEEFVGRITTLYNFNIKEKNIKGNLWLYKKLLNSKLQWLRRITSAECDSKGIIRYKIFGITVAKDF